GFTGPQTDISLHHRWANPDKASGLKIKINANKGATYTTTDPNGTGCTWAEHDCGPNSEAFSFHGNGAHCIFVDGHVAYVRESVSHDVLTALCTRNNATGEAGLMNDLPVDCPSLSRPFDLGAGCLAPGSWVTLAASDLNPTAFACPLSKSSWVAKSSSYCWWSLWSDLRPCSPCWRSA